MSTQHPELLLKTFNDRLEKPVADHVEVGDRFLVLAGTSGGGLDPVGKETHRIGAIEPFDGELGDTTLVGYIVGPPLGQRAQDDYSLGNRVTPQAPLVNEQVETFMNRLKALTDNGPVRLLANEV